MEHIAQHKTGQVHMIGIGGSSMSGLAAILLDQGYTLTGSDIADSEAVRELRDRGVKIFIGHAAENIEGATLVVHTAAVKADNPEMAAAKEAGIPVMERAILLGQLMQGYDNAIGISGTHGKTTTTSLISAILELAGKDPTIHIGGRLDLIGGSTKSGGKEIFVTEACEYVESFLHFFPTIAVILNIDNDHLDYFRDLDHIESAFTKYAQLVPETGAVIVNRDDPRCMSVLSKVNCRRVSFSAIGTDADWQAKHIEYTDMGYPVFDAYHEGEFFGRFALNVPGKHQVMNALAAIAATQLCGATAEDIQKGFSAFHGVDRRFDEAGVKNGMRIIHDYAHHPTEVRTFIDAAAMQHPGRLIAVFQPHTYSRLINLFDAFCTSFDVPDEIIVTDVYAAREKDPGTISPKDLVEALQKRGRNARYIGPFSEIADHLVENGKEGDMILTIGAGTIEKLNGMILDHE